MGLSALTQTQLNDWVIQATQQIRFGQLPSYIPLLATANPNTIAVRVHELTGRVCSAGNIEQPFALMSVIKPFVLLFLLERLGRERVFEHVGIDPSEQPFHSVAQLQEDRGFPRNPMINSGAIVLASLLPGRDAFSRCEALRHWLNHQSGSQLTLDEVMLASVRSLGNEANRTIAQLLAQAGYLEAVETALDTYNHVCCLSGTVTDLAHLGLLLVRSAPPLIEHQRIVNALMLTCGLYETSGRFAVQIGLPMKSGVSGALLAIVPGQGAIACYSPTLDPVGNSVAGLFLLEQLTQTLNVSLFS